jgi:hypothetical protein
MRRYQVYALGQDTYWLKAVARIADESISVKLIHCTQGYPECLPRLPQADREALILVDATGQSDVATVVQWLRGQGWRYVVVVAADPSSREAHAVLREAEGYDYWTKTYASKIIRRSIEECLSEMRQGKDEGRKTKRDSSNTTFR